MFNIAYVYTIFLTIKLLKLFSILDFFLNNKFSKGIYFLIRDTGLIIIFICLGIYLKKYIEVIEVLIVFKYKNNIYI